MNTDTLKFQVTQASLNQTANDWDYNMANIYAAIDEAAYQGSDIITFEELAATGYDVGDEFKRTDNKRIITFLKDLAIYANELDPNLLVSIGHPVRYQDRNIKGPRGAEYERVKNPIYDQLNKPFNVQTLIGGGHILGMTAKTNLYNDGRGYENRYFNEHNMVDFNRLGGRYGTLNLDFDPKMGLIVPFGRPIIHVTDGTQAINIAHIICQEKWMASKFDGFPWDDSRFDKDNIAPSIMRYLRSKKGLVLLVADASPPAIGKVDQHIHLDKQLSQYGDIIINTDGLGTSGSVFTQFGGQFIAQNNEILAQGRRLSFNRAATTTSVVEVHNAPESTKARAHGVLSKEFKAKAKKILVQKAYEVDPKAAWDDPNNPFRSFEERIRNQALWTYDYMRKSGSNVAVNALSGGQDSGFNCTMDYVSIALAMDERGVETVCDELNVPYKKEVMNAYKDGGEEAALEAFMNNYLITVYMPTQNNPDEHEQAARELIEGGEYEGKKFKGIGGQFIVRSIQDLVTQTAMTYGIEDTSKLSQQERAELFEELSEFVHANPHDYMPKQMKEWGDKLQERFPMLEDLTSVALPGQSIAYENFQARLRTVLIWAIANVKKGVPRANPNLSETYTNNTTAAGDLQGGGFNPNGGMHKIDEQRLLLYLEQKGVQGVVAAIKALRTTNANKPSAGLLPLKDGELDQDDEKTMQASMPQLKVLAYYKDHATVDTPYGSRELHVGDVYDQVKDHESFKGLDENELFNTVVNFYRRWWSGQFKIHMATISPTLGESVDHQTSRRTPNLNGGSQDETAALAIDLLFKWAERDGLGWKQDEYNILQKRAWQDEAFVKELFSELYNKNDNKDEMTFDLSAVYERINAFGWDGVFTPLDTNHPIAIIDKAYKNQPKRASFTIQ